MFLSARLSFCRLQSWRLFVYKKHMSWQTWRRCRFLSALYLFFSARRVHLASITMRLAVLSRRWWPMRFVVLVSLSPKISVLLYLSLSWAWAECGFVVDCIHVSFEILIYYCDLKFSVIVAIYAVTLSAFLLTFDSANKHMHDDIYTAETLCYMSWWSCDVICKWQMVVCASVLYLWNCFIKVALMYVLCMSWTWGDRLIFLESGIADMYCFMMQAGYRHKSWRNTWNAVFMQKSWQMQFNRMSICSFKIVGGRCCAR